MHSNIATVNYRSNTACKFTLYMFRTGVALYAFIKISFFTTFIRQKPILIFSQFYWRCLDLNINPVFD